MMFLSDLPNTILFISNLILMFSMIPQVFKTYKDKRPLSVYCCALTCVPLFCIAASNLLIGYSWYAVIPSIFTASLWAVLLVMSVKYK